MKTLCFIFSWKGQYQNAVLLEEQLSPLVDKLYVVNSDDDNTPEHWVNIGNECYFSDQFRKALEIAKTEDYDVFWHVQADASYSDWASIVEAARSTYASQDWGVYGPNVDDTFYISSRTDVMSLENNLKVVATTDNTCWFIKKEIIEFIDSNEYLMRDNQLGWGWDLIACGYAHMNKMKVVRDYNFKINHPASTGYKKDQAEKEMQETYNRCPKQLQQVIYQIKTSPSSLSNIYLPKINAPKSAMSKGVFVYNT